MRETDLFPPVKTLLEKQGYTVYSEVEGPGGRADVVGVRGPELITVELKTTLSLDLIEQGERWTHYAHRSYVAVPKRRYENTFAEVVLRKFGIGLIEVTLPDERIPKWMATEPNAWYVEWCTPRWNHNVLPHLRQALRPEQKDGPPGGSVSGGYVTDYKLTMSHVKDFLKWRTMDGEWLTVKEILDKVDTHYATPRNSLANALVRFEAEWCETKVEGGKRYYRHRREK